MNPNFRTIVFAAALAGAGLAGAGLAGASRVEAMPLAGVAPAAAATVEQVAWGCGPGWHPNPWGRCVPNRRYWGGPYYGPRRFYGPRPWGYHRPYYRGW
jgi:hypothetical protein